MLKEQLRIGDRVELNISADRRATMDKNTPPNGTRGTVRGFYQYKEYSELFGLDMKLNRVSGIYIANGAAYVDWDIQLTFKQYEDLRGKNVELIDKEEAERRYQEEWVKPVLKDKTVGSDEVMSELIQRTFISALPETAFYPLDRVAIERDSKHATDSDDEYEYVITGREWDWVKRGESMCYQVTLYKNYGDEDEVTSHGSLNLREEDLKLVSRGPVWCHYHHVTYKFNSIQEEMSLAKGLGKSEEICNPKTGKYNWPKEDILEALQAGLIDAVSTLSLFGASRASCHRFDDRDLGELARRKTLESFGLTTS